MEELRKEYEGLGLDNAQIIQAKSLKLTPEQIKDIIQVFKNTMCEFEKLWDSLAKALQGIINSEGFKSTIETLKAVEQMKSKDIPREKGKPLKNWNKVKFYQ